MALQLLPPEIFSRILEFADHPSRKIVLRTSRWLHHNSLYIFDRKSFPTFEITVSLDGIKEASDRLDYKAAKHIKTLIFSFPYHPLDIIQTVIGIKTLVTKVSKSALALERIIYRPDKPYFHLTQLVVFASTISSVLNMENLKFQLDNTLPSDIYILKELSPNYQQFLTRVDAIDIHNISNTWSLSDIKEVLPRITSLTTISVTTEYGIEDITFLLRHINLDTFKNLTITATPNFPQEELRNFCNKEYPFITLNFNNIAIES
jgi:hypothetical protein